MSGAATPTQRIDRWLWHARMFRTRSLASRFAVSGKIRVDGTRVAKASHPVAPGNVLTFPLGERIRILRILALAERRGPYAEAVGLYEELNTGVPAAGMGACAPRRTGGSRPTKLDRRRMQSFISPDDRGDS